MAARARGRRFRLDQVHADRRTSTRWARQMRSVVPYYPLLMQTKSDTLLYQVKGDKHLRRYMTLGQGMYVELLAESDTYAYVRTSEGGAGAYDCGDFGYPPDRRSVPGADRARASAWRRRTTRICPSSC